jgi:hypothetical protein
MGPATRALDNPHAILYLQVAGDFGRTRPLSTRIATVLLLVLPGAMSDRIDGPAGRYVQMGHALKASVRVRIAAPGEASIEQPGIPIVSYSLEESLRAILDSCPISLVPCRMFDTFRSLGRTRTRLIVDLSDRIDAGNPGLRVGDFFVCATEEEREYWLQVLIASGRITRRARRNTDLRRLIDVVRPGPKRQQGTEGGQTNDAATDWERAVDPLRLYCTSTSRGPRGWAWAPPSVGSRAIRILRENGAPSLARRSVAYLCRHHAVVRRLEEGVNSWCREFETAIRRVSGSTRPTLPVSAIVARLAAVKSLLEYHEILAEHGLLGRDPRFMDLEIDVSNKCNIRCRMCYFSFDHVFNGRSVYLPPSTFASIARAILPHARAVMLSLGSEPLTSPQFITILATGSPRLASTPMACS